MSCEKYQKLEEENKRLRFVLTKMTDLQVNPPVMYSEDCADALREKNEIIAAFCKVFGRLYWRRDNADD